MSCPFASSGGPAPHPLPVHQEESSNEETLPIPQPPEHLFGLLGNLPDVEPAFPTRALWKLAELYGPIYKMNLRSPVVVVSNQQYINEVCDETRFEKLVAPVLQEVRSLLGDGLFTADSQSKGWWKAHRVLAPSFGPIALRKMFPEMMDIASQMILRWDRQGPDHAIDVADDFTRLAFDTIGFCAFSYRFNEFYSENQHPFAQQMGEVLLECGKRASRTSVENGLHIWSEAHRQENIKKMHALADEIVAERKRNPQPDNKDLLNVMLSTADPDTGEKLSDENVRNNMVTFLLAGHETTSSTLGFCCYNLMKNPEKLLKAQKQVDEVVGDSVLEMKHLSQLSYIDAIIKETLRLDSPINVFVVHAKKDTKLGGKYPVTKDTAIECLLRVLHHDPAVWGEDANEFRPERMMDGGFEALPPNAWKPFGNGLRACIGRFFAEQEMRICLALLLQRFQLQLDDPSYELELKSTLTIKAKNLKMKVRRRPGKSLMTGLPGGIPSDIARAMQKHDKLDEHPADTSKQSPIAVYFGGNSGTCKSLGEDLETKAASHGMKVTLSSLDSATEQLPADRPVIIITASYEGQPPDNARKFVKWLEMSEKETLLEGVNYAVFGVGNSDWASTFHKVPKLVDRLMSQMGAKRLIEPGFTNIKLDPIGPWEDWTDGLWGNLSKTSGSSSSASVARLEVSVQPSPSQKALVSEEINAGTVLTNYQLAGTEVGPAKKHMEIRLPEDTGYTTGDYLVVLPHNPPETVQRVLQRFKLSEGDSISVSNTSKKFLPTSSTSALDFFSTSVELGAPVTRRQLETISSFTSEDLKSSIQKLAEESTYSTILTKRTTILDILDTYPVSLPLEYYIDMLPALAPRQYSISSSPLATAHTAPTSNPRDHPDITSVSLTYDVLTAPALSNPDRTFTGVCSTYLSSRKPGDRIACFVRPTAVGFRLPTDPATPVLMFAAGTGIAPMMAFLQERAAIAEAGQKKLGPAALFFGCRDSEKDFLYKKQLLEWQDRGVVRVFPAFSRGSHEGGEPKYVQDAIWQQRELVAGMFKDGGRIYVCGSAERLAKGAREVCLKIYREKTGADEEGAEEWFEGVRTVRYVADVY